MVRWQAGARERLQAAALELFAEYGFDGVTVAQIAATADLTERTFFRHFADKREVLFGRQEEFEQLFLDGVAATPGDDPMALVSAALRSASAFFPDERRDWMRARQRVIDAHVAFRERDLLKMSALAASLARALAARGVAPSTARLAADTAITIFRSACTSWMADGESRGFAEIQAGVLARLQSLVASP